MNEIYENEAAQEQRCWIGIDPLQVSAVGGNERIPTVGGSNLQPGCTGCPWLATIPLGTWQDAAASLEVCLGMRPSEEGR